MKNKGFTLVELLVVIAIVGILSAVVLASLNVARSKAADAKVKAQIASVRAAAELFYEKAGSYNGSAGFVSWDCTTPNSMFQDVDSGMSQYVNPANYPPFAADIRCSSINTEYSVSAPLGTPGDFWCVDASGVSKLVQAIDHISAHPDDFTTCK
jgi:prepilin-type N-terminal cleavage/methylation domain-containing protein